MAQQFPYAEKKCWGSVTHLFGSPNAAVSHLKVERGWRCSRHMHAERANQFFVLSGSIAVEEWPFENQEELKTLKVLQAGEEYTVPSMILHRFRVITTGEVIEVYWPDRKGTCRHDDIIRLDVGGQDDLSALHGEVARCLKISH